jgi:hypothetical protein
MPYTRFGPFTNGSFTPSPISATFLNGVEDALVGAAAAQVAPVATGVAATDTAALQAAFATAASTSTNLALPPGKYVLNAGLTWNANRASLTCLGDVVLDFTALTGSTPALTITGNNDSASGYYSHVAAKYTLSGFRMNGPNTDASTVDGILLTDPGVGVDGVNLDRIFVSGFRDNITFGNNTWSTQFRSVYVGGAHRYNVNLTSGTNAGECQSWYGGAMAGAHNLAGTAINLYAPLAGGGVDFKMFGGSLDYSDQEFDLNTGNIQLIGVHIENNKQTPFGTFGNNSGGSPLVVDLIGCTYGPTETTARDHLFELKPASTGRMTVNFTGGGGSKYNAATKFLVDNSGDTAGAISVTLNNPTVNGGGNAAQGNALQFGDYFNQLYNGAFEDSTAFVTGGILGWTAGATYTWTIGTGNARSGNCLQVTGTGTAATSTTYQRFALSARRPIDVSGWIATPAYTAGTIGIYVQFYAVDGTTAVGGAYRLGSVVTAAQSYFTVQRRITPPRGAAYAAVQCVVVNLNGTAVFDDIQITQL